MDRLIKVLFFAIVVKPIVLIILGLNVQWREKLPMKGPAILAPNHNSHLDTLVLMSLYPLSVIHKVRPVAAADYFLEHGGFLAWWALTCIGIIPLDRSGQSDRNELFHGCNEALDSGNILIIFPEGSRGDPELMGKIRKGIFYLIKDRVDTQVTPVMMHGLGRALPKGEALLVPFNCDVVIGDEIAVTEKSISFMSALRASFADLSQYLLTKHEVHE